MTNPPEQTLHAIIEPALLPRLLLSWMECRHGFAGPGRLPRPTITSLAPRLTSPPSSLWERHRAGLSRALRWDGTGGAPTPHLPARVPARSPSLCPRRRPGLSGQRGAGIAPTAGTPGAPTRQMRRGRGSAFPQRPPLLPSAAAPGAAGGEGEVGRCRGGARPRLCPGGAAGPECPQPRQGPTVRSGGGAGRARPRGEGAADGGVPGERLPSHRVSLPAPRQRRGRWPGKMVTVVTKLVHYLHLRYGGVTAGQEPRGWSERQWRGCGRGCERVLPGRALPGAPGSSQALPAARLAAPQDRKAHWWKTLVTRQKSAKSVSLHQCSV